MQASIDQGLLSPQKMQQQYPQSAMSMDEISVPMNQEIVDSHRKMNEEITVHKVQHQEKALPEKDQVSFQKALDL